MSCDVSIQGERVNDEDGKANFVCTLVHGNNFVCTRELTSFVHGNFVELSATTYAKCNHVLN